MGVMVTVRDYITFDMDLGEVSTAEMIEELTNRNIKPDQMPGDGMAMLARLHGALKLGQDADALRYAREYVADALGVIL